MGVKVKRNKFFFIIVIFALTIVLTSIPSYGLILVNKLPINNSGTVLYVGGVEPGNYSTIQSAIDDANSGDTVYVYDDSSPYNEHIIINKSINLIGEDKNTTIIQYHEEDEIVFITANEVVLTGFTIQNSIDGFPYSDGVHLVSNDCKIINNIIKKNIDGIFVEYSSDIIIKGNNLIYNIRGIYLKDRDEYCFNNLITENFIVHNHECGIRDFDFDYGTIATWNVIADNGKIRPFRAGGISKEDSYGIFHHNDIFFNDGNVDVGISRHGSSWDDGSEGNYWDDWESNPGYPDTYIIPKEPYEADDIDYHPSPIPYMESLVVSIEKYPYYALVNETINFIAFFNVDPSSIFTWFWDFGDGSTSNEMAPSYSYPSTGHYNLSITITDYNGKSDTSKSEVYIGRSPENTTITGPTWGLRKNVRYYYNISAIDPDGDDIYYFIDWGDHSLEEWIGPYPSGEVIKVSHIWYLFCDNYITVTPKDTADLIGEEVWVEIHFGRSNAGLSHYWLTILLERFPMLERLLNFIINI
jgi:parallel beta-helix repeat protein